MPPGWVGNDAFLAGYGAAQAVPGPLFTFAAYLGAVMRRRPTAGSAALLCLVAIFLPSFLLRRRRAAVLGATAPHAGVRAALRGRQCRRGRAAARGALQSGLDQRDPRAGRFRRSRRGPPAAGSWRAPPWLVVILGAAAAFAANVHFRDCRCRGLARWAGNVLRLVVPRVPAIPPRRCSPGPLWHRPAACKDPEIPIPAPRSTAPAMSARTKSA